MGKTPEVKIENKILLTIEEASVYSGISQTVIRSRLKTGDYNFVIKNGTKTMIKRKKFEEYLEDADTI